MDINPAMNDPFSALLAEVPIFRTKLEVWKEKYGVVTDPIPPHPSDAPDADRWRAFRSYYDDYIAHGITEEDACMDLAENLRLPWLQSIAQSDLGPAPERSEA